MQQQEQTEMLCSCLRCGGGLLVVLVQFLVGGERFWTII